MIRALCLFPILVLCACASPAPEPTYYLLRPATQAGSGTLQASAEYRLGEIEIAPYINQSGLLLETGEGQVRPAALHLWAEPIHAGIHSYLSQEISRLYGREIATTAGAPASIAIRIDQLHGTLQGEARLVAYWWIQRGEEVDGLSRFARSLPLAENGYAALAAAERELLSQLAAEIAAGLATPSSAGDAAQ